MNRPLLWSIRRELWENRAITIAPLAVATLILIGVLISNFSLPQRIHGVMALDVAKQRATVERPFDFTAGLVLATAFIVGFFYCLDALHGERRDRSILFWKSLPVSDRTTVLSKISIPLVVLPLFSFIVIVAAQIVILASSTAILLGSGPALATLWSNLKIVQLWIALLYSLIAIALWHAPLYAWLLFISAWARRAAILWAVLPPLALCMLETMIFNTKHFALLLQYRLIGWFERAFIPRAHNSAPIDPLTAMTPATYLGTPGLWIGLIFAAAFLAAAVRLRRYREPI
jgi:ABC-2 type transport system permease protein